MQRRFGFGARYASIVFAVSWVAGWIPLFAFDEFGVAVGFPWGTAWIECTLLAAVLAVGRYTGTRLSASDVGWHSTAPRPALGWTVLALIGWYVLTVIYFVAVDPPESVNPFEDRDATTLRVVLMGVVGIVLAPVMEETFFRGVIYGGMRRSWPAPVAALVSASLFGLIHWSFGLGDVPLLALPDLVIFGLITCALYERTNSLYPGMALHAYVNAWFFAVVADPVPGVLILVGLLASAACLLAPWLGRRHEQAAFGTHPEVPKLLARRRKRGG